MSTITDPIRNKQIEYEEGPEVSSIQEFTVHNGPNISFIPPFIEKSQVALAEIYTQCKNSILTLEYLMHLMQQYSFQDIMYLMQNGFSNKLPLDYLMQMQYDANTTLDTLTQLSLILTQATSGARGTQFKQWHFGSQEKFITYEYPKDTTLKYYNVQLQHVVQDYPEAIPVLLSLTYKLVGPGTSCRMKISCDNSDITTLSCNDLYWNSQASVNINSISRYNIYSGMTEISQYDSLSDQLGGNTYMTIKYKYAEQFIKYQFADSTKMIIPSQFQQGALLDDDKQWSMVWDCYGLQVPNQFWSSTPLDNLPKDQIFGRTELERHFLYTTIQRQFKTIDISQDTTLTKLIVERDQQHQVYSPFINNKIQEFIKEYVQKLMNQVNIGHCLGDLKCILNKSISEKDQNQLPKIPQEVLDHILQLPAMQVFVIQQKASLFFNAYALQQSQFIRDVQMTYLGCDHEQFYNSINGLQIVLYLPDFFVAVRKQTGNQVILQQKNAYWFEENRVSTELMLTEGEQKYYCKKIEKENPEFRITCLQTGCVSLIPDQFLGIGLWYRNKIDQGGDVIKDKIALMYIREIINRAGGCLMPVDYSEKERLQMRENSFCAQYGREQKFEDKKLTIVQPHKAVYQKYSKAKKDEITMYDTIKIELK